GRQGRGIEDWTGRRPVPGPCEAARYGNLDLAFRPALNTGPAVTALCHEADSLPLRAAVDGRADAGELHTHTGPRAFRAGRAMRRAPSATARMVAAAASIRPRLRAFASLALPAGSMSVIASAKAERR